MWSGTPLHAPINIDQEYMFKPESMTSMVPAPLQPPSFANVTTLPLTTSVEVTDVARQQRITAVDARDRLQRGAARGGALVGQRERRRIRRLPRMCRTATRCATTMPLETVSGSLAWPFGSSASPACANTVPVALNVFSIVSPVPRTSRPFEPVLSMVPANRPSGAMSMPKPRVVPSLDVKVPCHNPVAFASADRLGGGLPPSPPPPPQALSAPTATPRQTRRRHAPGDSPHLDRSMRFLVERSVWP